MTTQSLNNVDIQDAIALDKTTFGKEELWRLIGKVGNEEEEWIETTTAMDTGNGCLVRVSTKVFWKGEVTSCAEAIAFVPGITIRYDSQGNPYLTRKQWFGVLSIN